MTIDWEAIPSKPRYVYDCVLAEWAGANLKHWLTATSFGGLDEGVVFRGVARSVLHYGELALEAIERETELDSTPPTQVDSRA